MKNWVCCLIVSIVCRLLGLVAVLAFVYAMVVLTGSLGCLWLLFLLLTVEFIPIPVYKFNQPTSDNDEKENKNVD